MKMHDLAVINKPAGMMVHAGSGQNEDARSRGTLVNALLFRFKALSSTGGDLRPGIVHRLDKDTSGLIIVAKNDAAHAALGELFSEPPHQAKPTLHLSTGAVERQKGTITRRFEPRPYTPHPHDHASCRKCPLCGLSLSKSSNASSHALANSRLLRCSIETGRTHQIRVHMASIGHPVVGDALYGASGQLTDQEVAQSTPSKAARRNLEPERLRLGRNFLHAARLEFVHPVTGKTLQLESPLPEDLDGFLTRLKSGRTEPVRTSVT